MTLYRGTTQHDFSGMIPEGAGNPGVECDEDGTVTVRWVPADCRRSFALTIFPSGKMFATTTIARAADEPEPQP